MIKHTVMAKFAISPTPPVPEPIIKRRSSLTADAKIPDIGPKINPERRINAIEKSSCKKDAAGNIGNSNKDITKDNAANAAVPTSLLVTVTFSFIRNAPLF